MKKSRLSTYWTASEVHNVLEFLAELQAVIKVNYADELSAFYREMANEKEQEHCDFEDDIIPFYYLSGSKQYGLRGGPRSLNN